MANACKVAIVITEGSWPSSYSVHVDDIGPLSCTIQNSTITSVSAVAPKPVHTVLGRFFSGAVYKTLREDLFESEPVQSIHVALSNMYVLFVYYCDFYIMTGKSTWLENEKLLTYIYGTD